MQYLNMLPYQVRKAIDDHVPVILPLGVIEYHAEHLPLGVDCFTCINAIERVEKRHPEVVVLPPFYYGAASLAVAKPERNGTVHVDAEKIIPVAEENGTAVAESEGLALSVLFTILGSDTPGGDYTPLAAASGAELLSYTPPFAFRVAIPGDCRFFKVRLDIGDHSP